MHVARLLDRVPRHASSRAGHATSVRSCGAHSAGIRSRRALSAHPCREPTHLSASTRTLAGSVAAMDEDEQDRNRQQTSEEPGARGGDESPNADRLPATPADDGTPLGDTDQHSGVSSDRSEGELPPPASPWLVPRAARARALFLLLDHVRDQPEDLLEPVAFAWPCLKASRHGDSAVRGQLVEVRRGTSARTFASEAMSFVILGPGSSTR